LRAGVDIALRLPAINIAPSRSAVFLDTTSNLTTPEDEGDDDDDELRQCAAPEPMFSSAAKKQVGRAGAHRDDDGDETRHSLCQASAGWRGSIRVIRDRAKQNSKSATETQIAFRARLSRMSRFLAGGGSCGQPRSPQTVGSLTSD
jgi:hypothetical protein